MALITGDRRHAKRLRSMRDVSRPVTAALYSAGQDIELDAEQSITQGSISGQGTFPRSRASRLTGKPASSTATSRPPSRPRIRRRCT